MKRISLLILFIILMLLPACNFPAPEQKQLPTTTETASSVPPTNTTLPQPTETWLPTSTVDPLAGATSTPSPPAVDISTPDLSDLLAGEPIALLSAGADLTIHEVKMITDQEGWAISRVDPGIDHILVTKDGGSTWQDVTPPQPGLDQRKTLHVSAAFPGLDTAFVYYHGSQMVWTTQDGGLTWSAGAVQFPSRYGALFAALDADHAWVFQFLDAGMSKVYTSLVRTTDGGDSWQTILDPYTDASIQSFDKTGVVFVSPQEGILTRNFRGVAAYVEISLTTDGGKTWENIRIPPPPSQPEILKSASCACGLYDPSADSIEQITARLTCSCFFEEGEVFYNYLYQTSNGGDNWTISPMPEGELYSITDSILFAVSRDIKKSTDGGATWNPVKTVNWDGEFSFINQNLAWGVAYDPQDEEYALVKTTDGCNSFEIIRPQLLPSPSSR